MDKSVKNCNNGSTDQYNLSNSEWVYLPPESVGEAMLDMSCDYVD